MEELQCDQKTASGETGEVRSAIRTGKTRDNLIDGTAYSVSRRRHRRTGRGMLAELACKHMEKSTRKTLQTLTGQQLTLIPTPTTSTNFSCILKSSNNSGWQWTDLEEMFCSKSARTPTFL